MLLAGLVLRVVATARGDSTGVLGPIGPIGAHAVGLVLAGLVCALLVRHGVWRWLAALTVLPALLDPRVLGAEQQPGWRWLLGAVATAVLVCALWRARPRSGLLAGTAACVLVGVVGVLVLRALHGSVEAESLSTVVGLHTPAVLLGLSVLLGLGGVLGLGRARGCYLRWPAAVTLVVPVVDALAGPSWTDAPWALAWWPVAGALGLTALLRGARGAPRRRPGAAEHGDEVDLAALAGFRARYGTPVLGPVVVVIAAYHEETGLPGVLAALPDRVLGLAADVVVVDDGSSDGTAAAAGAAAYVVACDVNRGQGAALRLGYRVAREHGARYILTTDADGQYDVGDFAALLAPLTQDRADFVTGSRVLGHQQTRDRVRRLGVHVFAWTATLLTGRRLTDTSFGLRAMRAEVTAQVTLDQPQYQSSELLLGVISHGYRVLEVPATMHVRAAGVTKKGRNLVYGRRYAGVVLGTWWREGCPRPALEDAAAVRETDAHGDH